ncbi:hypothetical protein [Rickettsia endosymbiont of Seladonia tumulorum]
MSFLASDRNSVASFSSLSLNKNLSSSSFANSFREITLISSNLKYILIST